MIRFAPENPWSGLDGRQNGIEEPNPESTKSMDGTEGAFGNDL